MKSLALFSLALGLAYANCQIHIQKLEHKLQIAKSYNNTGQIRSLERAISQAKAHCSDSSQAKLQNKLNDLETFYEGKLDDLKDQKNSLSKSDYLSKKEFLERQKRQIKRAYKARKEELKQELKTLRYSHIY